MHVFLLICVINTLRSSGNIPPALPGIHSAIHSPASFSTCFLPFHHRSPPVLPSAILQWLQSSLHTKTHDTCSTLADAPAWSSFQALHISSGALWPYHTIMRLDHSSMFSSQPKAGRLCHSSVTIPTAKRNIPPAEGQTALQIGHFLLCPSPVGLIQIGTQFITDLQPSIQCD